MVTVRLFGSLREACGKDRLIIDDGAVRDALAHVAESGADDKLLRSCVMFVNNRPLRGISRLAVKLRDGDELALLPPVGGG